MDKELVEKYKNLLKYLTSEKLIHSIVEFHENDFSTLINKNLLIIIKHKTKNLQNDLDWFYPENEENTKYIIFFLLNTVVSNKKPIDDYQGKNLIIEDIIKYKVIYWRIFQFLKINHKHLIVNDYIQIKHYISCVYKDDKKQFEKIWRNPRMMAVGLF